MLWFLQPEGSFCLTVTWTPTDEGGIRELITFVANGLLKHQAIMLGRAEAPKKKKVEMITAFVADRREVLFLLFKSMSINVHE